VTRKAAWSTCALPPRLKPGDVVAVPAPSGPVPREALEAGLALLASRYTLRWDERVFERHGFLAGEDDRRADELNRYLADPDVRAIVCARGGYGLMRILDRLDTDALRRNPKLVVGFSDATALLCFAVSARVRPIHGPMVVQLGGLPPENANWLYRLLESPTAPGEVPAPAPLERIGARGGGSVQGRLVAGNLEVLTRLIGTPWEMDLGASVLAIEDVGERPYRIDRMLTQLHLGGQLRAVRGVVAGEFTRCVEADGSPPTVEEVIDERLAAFDIPGVSGLRFGHGAENVALPWGAKCTLDLAAGKLVLEEGAVAKG
jgi:muramoyltetrapeptide carboxypeptidase